MYERWMQSYARVVRYNCMEGGCKVTYTYSEIQNTVH